MASRRDEFGLTKRQAEVVKLLYLTNKEIAQRIGTSPSNVEHIVGSLFELYGVRTRTDIMLVAIAHGAAENPYLPKVLK